MVRGRKTQPKSNKPVGEMELPELNKEIGPEGATSDIPPMDIDVDPAIAESEGDEEVPEHEGNTEGEEEAAQTTKKKKKNKSSTKKKSSSVASGSDKEKEKKQVGESSGKSAKRRLQTKFDAEDAARQTKDDIAVEEKKRKALVEGHGLTQGEATNIYSTISAKSTLERVLATENYTLQDGEIDEILKYTERRPDKGVEIVPFFLDGYRAGLSRMRIKKETEMVKLVEAMSTCLKEQKEQVKVQAKQIVDLKAILQAEKVQKRSDQVITEMPKSVAVPTTKVKKGKEILDIESDDEDSDEDEEKGGEHLGPAAKLFSNIVGKKRGNPDAGKKETKISVKKQDTGKNKGKRDSQGKDDNILPGDKGILADEETVKKYEYYRDLMGFTDEELIKLCGSYTVVEVLLYICSGKMESYWKKVKSGKVSRNQARETITDDIITYVATLNAAGFGETDESEDSDEGSDNASSEDEVSDDEVNVVQDEETEDSD